MLTLFWDVHICTMINVSEFNDWLTCIFIEYLAKAKPAGNTDLVDLPHAYLRCLPQTLYLNGKKGFTFDKATFVSDSSLYC